MYRFNLERDKGSRKAIQAAGGILRPTGAYLRQPRQLLLLWTFRSALPAESILTGRQVLLTAQEPFYRGGASFNFNYRKLNLLRGIHVRTRSPIGLPIDATGTLVPLPIALLVQSQLDLLHGVPSTFGGGFLQSDYLVHTLDDVDHALGRRQLPGGTVSTSRLPP